MNQNPSSTNSKESEIFESRKRDHLELALRAQNQTVHLNELDKVELVHEALPDLNFDEIDTRASVFGEILSHPFFVSSMTAGHTNAIELNTRIAQACEARGWAMGVGSQRRQLFDREARQEWAQVRTQAPSVMLFGNIGVSQLIQTPTEKIQELVDSLEAKAMIVHLNPLQECLQPEGTPQFSGGLKAIERLSHTLDCPIVVKETGCGMSYSTMKRLADVGVSVIDVSGAGGTHWGRIEGQRSEKNSKLALTAETFKDWGISTLRSVLEAQQLSSQYDIAIWASGGVRNGLDAAKLLSVGAKMVGFAKLVLEKAMISQEALNTWMDCIENELRVSMFCTNSRDLKSLKGKVR